MTEQPVRLLLARRTDELAVRPELWSAIRADLVERLTVGPLSLGAVHGLLRAGLRHQPLEPMEVELTVADPDEVAGGLRHDQIPADCLAQLGDVHLERRRGGVGR